MKLRSLSFIFLCVPALTALSQELYWQQEVHYDIHVQLNDTNRTLTGDLKLIYINHSPDSLAFIWFHLYPNAYKNPKTALARQVYAQRIANRNTPGYIDSLSFTVNNAPLRIENSEHPDIIKVHLPNSLFPGQQIEITTPFRIRLPAFRSRMGYFEKEFMIAHWYPKPAVYDRKGWHPMPYLNMGEFYSEFGSFSVTITVPSGYIVAATGELLTETEMNAYKTIGRLNTINPSSKVFYYPPAGEKKKSILYKADSVHDFAWFASKDFIIYYDTLKLSDINVVDVFSFGKRKDPRGWYQTTGYLKDAVRKYSAWIGPYEYPAISAVEGSGRGAGAGMEYPMITLITDPLSTEKDLDAIITHEAGHNWFYGMLGTNERDHPWMDEGINTYFQFRYEAEKYLSNSMWQIFYRQQPISVHGNDSRIFLNTILEHYNPILDPIAIETPSEKLKDFRTYLEVAYIKPAVWMSVFENSIGEEKFFHAFRSFFAEWKFRHPYPEDMKFSMEKAIGQGLTDIFDLLKKRGRLK